MLELAVQGQASLLPVVVKRRGECVDLTERGAGGHLVTEEGEGKRKKKGGRESEREREREREINHTFQTAPGLVA